MTTDTPATTSWWGSFTLNVGQSTKWQIGPLTLIIKRLNNEWQIAYESIDTETNDNAANRHSITEHSNELPESLKNNSRYVLSDPSNQLTITPQLADRQIISRPIMPFNLAAGEEVTVYVSTSLWLELSIGVPGNKILNSIPIQRLSDTWFGPSTQEGELCYASNTNCRMRVEEMPNRTHRAITPVLIRNQANTTLVVERINLPAPLLHLYATADNQLWTPQVTLTRDKDGDMASLKIASISPPEVTEATRISKPRIILGSGSLIRAFNAVFK